MPWVRFADDYLANPKIIGLSPLSCWLHVAFVISSARDLRDGHLTLHDVKTTASQAHIRSWRPLVAELCDAGLLVRNADDSYSIHDYLEYQPSRAAVLKERKMAADRQAKYKAAHAPTHAPSNAPSNAVTDRVSNGHPVPGPGINSISRKQQQQQEHAPAREDADPKLLADHLRRLEQERRTGAAASAEINSSDETDR